ncbi:hypothetical protein ABZT26_02595 [Streptomyces sp. NPDC005395]|uniref:hypothetical protein n=1 Tax=Streptomyces sp. NPDC005395 TaxID=3157042 RepID=UPI0033B61514
MPTLGCGTHSARIVDRDGATITDAHVLAKVEWTRVLDDTSSATVTIRPDGGCCRRLDRVRSWRHNLQIYRNDDFVWEGPIILPDWSGDEVTIQAVDVLGWLDRRVPHESIAFTRRDLTEIAAWLIEDGFAPDDPGHDVQIIGRSRILGDREYVKDIEQTGDHLRRLAETGIDYTAVGRRILILPEDHCERVGRLTDADFPDGLTVSEDGTAIGTRWIIEGRDGVLGIDGGKDAFYGLLEQYSEESSILDESSAQAAARSRRRGSLPAPVFISSQEATLSPDAAIELPSLVPGWCVDVTSTRTCRTISQSMKINGIKVTEDASGETVAVHLAPAGV